MAKISIIIPVYNSASTLQGCLDSILAQDFTDYEILFVDDGSADGSAEVLEKFKDQSSKVLVFHKPNGGVSSARNLALDNAQGEYIACIDCDDYVEPNYLSALYTHRDCDLLMSGYWVDYVKQDGTFVRREGGELPQTGLFDISNGCDELYLLFANGRIHVNWNKLFKRSIIEENHIRYNPISINEDYDFCIEYLKHARTIYAIPEVTYHWIHVEGKRTGVNSMPSNLVDIYLDAQQQTYPLFKDKTLVDQIFYFTYEIVARRFMIAVREGVITKEKCKQELNRMFSSKGVKDSWKYHKPIGMGDRMMSMLLKYKLFGLYKMLFLR